MMNPVTIALVNQAVAQAERSAIEAKAFAEKMARVAEAMPGTNGAEYQPFTVDLARALLPLGFCLVHKDCISYAARLIAGFKSGDIDASDAVEIDQVERALQRALNGGA